MFDFPGLLLSLFIAGGGIYGYYKTRKYNLITITQI